MAASIELWRKGRSWFPFTALSPVVLVAAALGVDVFVPNIGSLIISALHVLLWSLFIWIAIVDWKKPKT
jgi:hypothetical protein